MDSKSILKEMMTKAEPYCTSDDERKAIPIYIETDKYRKKMIDFLDIASKKGDVITHDQFFTLVVILSNEEEDEMKSEKNKR